MIIQVSWIEAFLVIVLCMAGALVLQAVFNAISLSPKDAK